MKMLQAQSYTTTATNPISVPNHSFITPKKSISPRRVARTFSSNLPQSSFTRSLPELVQPTPKLKSLPSPPPQRSPPPAVELPARVYVGYSVYKGKAVLTVAPRPPEFTSLDSGAFKISREGCLLLQFAPSAGPLQYDWNRKQVFSLSVEEIGSLINLGAKESCEFFHDPLKRKSGEGKRSKVLKVEPLHDGSGHMFNLSVQNKAENINENILIPVSKAEFAVFNSLFNFITPCLLGWNAFGSSIKPEVNIASQEKKTKNGLDRAISAI
ncbi:single-stranded DNA-binding protein WHY1, chloroplastic-like isoform X1 [Vicia villosa]|uniref:single-stranded DNA-binding protein WHY1, chloroplastic-like isoform X1 n=1 Tax=Vicia villosa TaxID=3911 RepID=UPI00273C2BFE|nr:single-stranded DNA-binding protein WHY1, chloroplastic-like isoform X1 [Vicia villosa]